MASTYNRITLLGLVSLAIAIGVGRFAFTPLLPLMQTDGLVSVAGGGTLASVHFLGYLLGAMGASKLIRSPRMTLRVSLLAIGIGTVGMGFIDSFPVWLFLRWLCGACSAFTLVLVSNYYVKYLAENGRPGKQGWIFSGVGAGIALTGLAALIVMATHTGSIAAWQYFGLLTLVLIVPLCAFVGPEIPDSRRQPDRRSGQRTPLSWSMVIAYGAAGIGYIIPATYLPLMAREIVQSPLIFGWSWPVFGLAAFLSTLLASRLERKFPTRQIWIASQAIMAVGLLLPAFLPSLSAINAAGICVGGTFMIVTMAGMKEAHRIAPADDVMRHIAAMTAAFAAGQMAGPVLGSAIYDMTGSFSGALLGTSAALALTALPLLRPSGKKARAQA